MGILSRKGRWAGLATAALITASVLNSGSATGALDARKVPKAWTVVYTDGPSYTATMGGVNVKTRKQLFPNDYDVLAVGAQIAVAEKWNGEKDVFHVRSSSGGSAGFTVTSIPGQRSSFIPQPKGTFVTETLPNGEALFLSYLAFPSGQRVVLEEYSLLTSTGYLWVEDGSSAPVGSSSGYIGAHQYKAGGGDRNREAFILLEVKNTGKISEKYRITDLKANYGNFITGFCVSKSGRKLAVTYFPGRGFRENLAIIDMTTGRAKHLDAGDYAITGQCFTSDSQVAGSVNDIPYLVDVGSRITYTRLKVPGDGYGMFVR